MSTKYKYSVNIAKKERQSNRMAKFLVFLSPLSLHSHSMRKANRPTWNAANFVTPKIAMYAVPTFIYSFNGFAMDFSQFSYFCCFFLFLFLTCDMLSSRWHESKTKTHTFCHTRQTCSAMKCKQKSTTNWTPVFLQYNRISSNNNLWLSFAIYMHTMIREDSFVWFFDRRTEK